MPVTNVTMSALKGIKYLPDLRISVGPTCVLLAKHTKKETSYRVFVLLFRQAEHVSHWLLLFQLSILLG